MRGGQRLARRERHASAAAGGGSAEGAGPDAGPPPEAEAPNAHRDRAFTVVLPRCGRLRSSERRNGNGGKRWRREDARDGPIAADSRRRDWQGRRIEEAARGAEGSGSGAAAGRAGRGVANVNSAKEEANVHAESLASGSPKEDEEGSRAVEVSG